MYARILSALENDLVEGVLIAMSNPEIDPNTKFEGWLHYPDNVKRQIVTSLEEWMKGEKTAPFVPPVTD